MRYTSECPRRSRGPARVLGLLVVLAGCSGGVGGRGDASQQEADEPDLTSGVDGDISPRLLVTPLVFAPTAHGFGINTVLAAGDPSALRARARATGTAVRGTTMLPEVRGADVARWRFDGLSPGSRYEYEILAAGADGSSPLYSGSAVTQRAPGEAFTFALVVDSHIGADLSFTNQGNPETLKRVAAAVSAASPDFMVNLGDMIDFHQYGFNAPPPSDSVARLAYLNYRTLLGDAPGHLAHFAVIGNWEGESGCYTAEEIARSRRQRLLYVPGPEPSTYPQGGSPNEDYYAFMWGDALFTVLNVMSYTPTEHLLSAYPGLPDDWTLGAEQLDWFTNTLANATAKWRFVLIHHTVGGAAGDDANSGYGRGGGQAAHVGEQAKVHELMLQYGVQIFFYGHDHVFTDMQVDGIHYSEPGSAGAPWLFTPAETGYKQSWQESGWGLVTVDPSAVKVQFIRMDGTVLYEYTL